MTVKRKPAARPAEVAHSGASSRPEVAHRLSALIDLFGTRLEAAAAAGMSYDQINKYRKGTAAPPFQAVAGMAEAQDVSLDWVAGRTDTMRPAALGEEAASYGARRPVAPLHRDVLLDVLAVVEEELAGKRLEPEKKAELILLLYEEICEEEGKMDRAKIVRLVKLAS